jgi:membrane protein
LVRAIEGFIEDDMLTYAAALSYQVFLSLFPFLIFLIALLGSLRIPSFFDWLLDQAQTVLPVEAAGVVEQVVGQVRAQAGGGLVSFGVVVALWSASAAIRMTASALNNAYDVEEERPVWKTYPLSILYTVLFAGMIVGAATLMLIGPQVAEWIAQQVELGSVFVALWSWLRIPVAVVLLMFIVALVYYQLPNIDQPFRFITPGSVLAVLAWIAASFGFSYYVRNFAGYGAIYGSLGTVIVLLLYLFISAAVLLFGAANDRQVEERTTPATERRFLFYQRPSSADSR